MNISGDLQNPFLLSVSSRFLTHSKKGFLPVLLVKRTGVLNTFRNCISPLPLLKNDDLKFLFLPFSPPAILRVSIIFPHPCTVLNVGKNDISERGK